MSAAKKKHTAAAESVNAGRHEKQCSICGHTQREEIEGAFVGWRSVNKIASGFYVSRDAVYRHARASGLLEKRRRNVRAALEHIINAPTNSGTFPQRRSFRLWPPTPGSTLWGS